MNQIESTLMEICKARELRVVEYARGHYQILGGPKVVNYWPFSRNKTVYVERARSSRSGVGMTPAQIVDLVFS